MKKLFIFTILLLLLSSWPALAADAPISSLTSATPALTDYMVIVDDPAGTPSSKRITIQSLADAVLGDMVAGDVPDISATYQPLDAFLTDIAALTDPGADKALFWDDSAGDIVWLTIGTGLSITGTTISAAGTTTFTGMTDTPANFTGAGGYAVMVNSTPDALEFVDVSGWDQDSSNDFDGVYTSLTSVPAGVSDLDDGSLTGVRVAISGTTLETAIAADDLILIYDTSATANRAMTRGNFVTGIGAGQAVVFDIGDDGGNDSTDLGEIATDGDTNSVITLDGPDKMLINFANNWPTADAAVAAASQVITDNAIATVDDADAADNDFAKFTAAGLEGRSYAEVRQDLGIDSAANLETTLSLGAYASDILGAADSDALVALLGLVAGDIPDISATYEVVDAEIVRADTNDTITAVWTFTGNAVNTANPWADNEVSDTITVGNAGTVDPDAIDGDTTDDGLIDQDVIEGFSGAADPQILFRDTDAAGTDEADEEAGMIFANLITATEDLEDSDMWFTIMQGGARTTVLLFDESDDQWETTKNIEVPDEAYNGTTWDGNSDIPTKNAIRDKFEGLSGTGTMTTVKESDSQVGGSDIATLDFGAGFDVTESPDTEVQIVLDLTEHTEDTGHVNFNGTSTVVEDFGLTSDADAGDFNITSVDRLEGVDAAVYIDLGGDGYVDIEADTAIRLLGPTTSSEAVTLTGTLDAGGATSTEIHNAAAADLTLDALGEIGIDDTDDAIAWHDGANGEVAGEVQVSAIYHKAWSFDPDAICDGDVDRLFLMTVGDEAPNGIIIDEWKVSFEADPTTEADLDLKYADAFIGVANAAVIDVLDTTAGVASEDTDASINAGAAVANTKVMYLEFGTAYTETGHQVIFEIWYHIEED